MTTVRKIILLFNAWRLIPCIILSVVSKNRDVIAYDVDRWCSIFNWKQQPAWLRLCKLLTFHPEFRNLFYYRTKTYNLLATAILRVILPPMNTLYLPTPKIGPGLFIQHGFSTIIAAASIGKDCWINQQVTIGFSNRTDCPTIGDGVTICAGAKVIGNVTLGNGSVIGANAVVVKNVPPNCTVVGIPGRIIKRDGVRVDESL